MKKEHLKHLYYRIGFGLSPQEVDILSKKTKEEVVDNLFKTSKKSTPINLNLTFFTNIKSSDLKERSVKLEFQRKSKQKVKDFGIEWFNRLKNPSEILREKMTLFWTNHFVCQSNNIMFIQKYNNLLRDYALGDFREFTKAVSKEAAMIQYLNNNQNKKDSPNENFARELMELFTLGNGNYSEKDITESARAFTGYANNFYGEFTLRKKHHDSGRKSFFNKKGAFNGDDIIDIILQQKQSARYISEKIYRYFVNENINQNHIDLMTNIFYDDFDIEKLMRFVLLSDWFYDDVNLGEKIKSPMEVLIGIDKVVPYKILKKNQAIVIQRLLGQILMDPPNVGGWKTGRNWIDSNTLMTRLRLPSILLNQEQITYSDLGNEEALLSDIESRILSKKAIIKTKANWNAFETTYGHLSKEELIQFLIPIKLNTRSREMLLNNKEIPLKDFCVQLMSLPEYQLC